MRKLSYYSFLAVLLLSIKITLGQSQFEPNPRYVVVPASYASIIKEHLITIDKNGLCNAAPNDLNQAQLILIPRIILSEPVSQQELFKNSVGVLYRCDSQLFRWLGEDGELPPNQRRQRSLLGFWNGQVISAASLFVDPLKTTAHYKIFGTIHSDDLAVELPQLFALRRDYQVLSPDEKPCKVNTMIDIYYSLERPRVIQFKGRDYTLSMDCVKR